MYGQPKFSKRRTSAARKAPDFDDRSVAILSLCLSHRKRAQIIRGGVIGGAPPLRDYCTGLLMPCERKSVEPMAALTAPHRTAAQHQSLLHFVGEGKWSVEKALGKVREIVLPEMERHDAIEAWIIDDTGFPKQGRHSVGVARQYCGSWARSSRGNSSLAAQRQRSVARLI
jgi:hypothetical protein